MVIAGIRQCSVADGPGKRFVVLLPGCQHHCAGCQAAQGPGSGVDMPIEELLDQLEEQPVDGLSITGGEPFDQPAALAPLARAVRAQGKTVWCWTGRTFEELAQGTGDHRALLEAIDVLVDSPRRPELSSAGHGGQRRVLAADSLAAGTVLLLPEA